MVCVCLPRSESKELQDRMSRLELELLDKQEHLEEKTRQVTESHQLIQLTL
jgi:hypothetical protein